MKCFSCGSELNEYDVCPQCGADVSKYKRIIKKSNSLYNDGLSKAKVRDLSGAIICLKESLRLNKRNTPARNLLGLVYFESGEIVLAMSEWIISRNYDGGKDNLANLYLEKIQSNQGRLNAINETIRKYNQALQYCYQGSYDLASIQLKKVLSVNERLLPAYHLLALVYMQTEEYEKAKRALIRALSIDSNNTKTLTYINEVNNILRNIEAEQSTDGRKKKKGVSTGNEIYTYENGTEMIIKPAFEKEKVGFSSVVNIIIGIVVGVLICYFLVLPARIEKKTIEFETQFIDVSNQLAEEQANHNQDKIALETATKENDELKKKVADLSGSSGKKRPVDYLMEAADAYVQNSENSSEVMESLENISEEDLAKENAQFKYLYDDLKNDTGKQVVEKYIEEAKSFMKSSDYEEAIEQYKKAYDLDKTNADVLMNLAHAYRQNGDTEKADECYRKIISDFPDTQNALDAKDFITADE